MNRLDLNMLVALDAVLQERSVSKAAERLGVTQPTMSAALARLRRHFRDELLHRSGNSYQLTPLAAHLAGRTGVALDGVQKIFATQPVLDIATSQREFTLVCSDYVAAIVGPAIALMLGSQAPQMRVHLQHTDPGFFATVEERMRAVDGLIMPHGFIQGLPHLDMYRDEWACIVSADNDTVGDELTVADLGRLPWVINFRGTTTTTALRHLTQLGVQVKTQVIADAFLLLPFFVEGTDRVAIVPRRLAEKVFRLDGLRLLPCPFEAPPLVQALWWHPEFERDVEHAWLRRQLAEIAEELGRSGQ